MIDYFMKEIQAGLHKNHMELPVPLEVLVLCGQMDPYEIDYERIKHFDNREFFQALFICLLKRFPEKENYDAWSAHMERLGKEEFQRKAVFSIARSMECKEKKTYIVNYPQLIEEGIPQRRESYSYGIYLYQRYHSVYMRLPAGVRRIVKKLLKEIILKRA